MNSILRLMAADQEYDSASEQAQAGQVLTDDIMDLQNREPNPMFFTPKDLHPRAGSNHGA
ncbi:hypothetical protein A2U01_0074886, partial [Trifolium medium]|nr:hypothetical protein [Trifolium medium]